MWWPGSENNLPDIYTDIFREITGFPKRALTDEAKNLPEPQVGDHVHHAPLPLFMQKLFVCLLQVSAELSHAIQKGDKEKAAALYVKREFLHHMLEFFLWNIPRPENLRYGFEWHIRRDFQIAFRAAKPDVRVVRVEAMDPPAGTRIAVESSSDEDGPPPAPEPLRIDKKKLH